MALKKPLLGLCPIGKFVFSNEDAVRYKGLVQQKLREWQVPFVDLGDALVEARRYLPGLTPVRLDGPAGGCPRVGPGMAGARAGAAALCRRFQ